MKKKFYIATTIPASLKFFKGQLSNWKVYFEICAISSDKERLQEVGEKEGVRTYYIPMKRRVSLFWDVWCLLKFIFLFVRERPYIVHGNTPKASLLSMVAAWITRRPIRIYMCHGLRYQTTKGLGRKVLTTMEKISCSCATEVICVSHGVKKILEEDKLCPANKSVVLGHGTAGGVDLKYFDRKLIEDTPSIRTTMGLPPDAFIFLFAGRVVKDKGVNELVEAFNRLSKENNNIYLIMIGNMESQLDPLNEKIIEIINNNDKIIALANQNDVRPFYRDSDALVLPTYREGIGMVLIEAGAMGLPSITTDIPGCNEVIIPGVNGDLVPAQDSEMLYQKMKEWISMPEKLKAYGKEGIKMMTERYDKRIVCENTLKEYLRLTNTSKQKR